MKKFVVLEKRLGETPLVCVEKWRKDAGVDKDVSLAYAGRLDPMASGKLLVLIGDECKQQEQYFDLDKEYEIEVLFGFSSDTGDVLGLAEYEKTKKITDKQFARVASELCGKIELQYPVYSSKTVDGKPLFLWQLEGRIGEIEIPTKESTVYTLNHMGTYELLAKELHERIFEKIDALPETLEASKELGRDFRRTEIKKRWNGLFTEVSQERFQVARFSCTCSSGTYMRVLAEVIGKRLGQKALALSIHRTRIVKFLPILRGVGIWVKCFD